jgi:hypothetical protein
MVVFPSMKFEVPYIHQRFINLVFNFVVNIQFFIYFLSIARFYFYHLFNQINWMCNACSYTRRKQTNFLSIPTLNWYPTNILDNIFIWWVKGISFLVFSIPKGLWRCNGSEISMPPNMIESETPIFNQYSLEPQSMGHLLLALLSNFVVHFKLFEK